MVKKKFSVASLFLFYVCMYICIYMYVCMLHTSVECVAHNLKCFSICIIISSERRDGEKWARSSKVTAKSCPVHTEHLQLPWIDFGILNRIWELVTTYSTIKSYPHSFWERKNSFSALQLLKILIVTSLCMSVSLNKQAHTVFTVQRIPVSLQPYIQWNHQIGLKSCGRYSLGKYRV